MKKLLTVLLMGLMLALFGCPKEEEAPPPPPQPASVPAEPPKPVEPEPKTPEEAKAKAEITEANVADQAKAIEMELDKEIEDAKKLGEEAK